MVIFELFVNYWWWHYTQAIRDIVTIYTNLIWFLWNYFSIRQLLRTFFVPWKRLRENSSGGFELFNFFSSIVITFLMRIVGVVIRSAVIIIGIFSIILAVILSIGVIVTWIFMPLIIVLMLTVGLQLMAYKF